MGGSQTRNMNGVYGSLGVPNPSNVPGGRWSLLSFYSKDSFLVFGGFGYAASGSGW